MRFTFEVNVEVEREQGKFASRDEIAGHLSDWLENCNESYVSTDEGGEYAVADWSVDEIPQPKRMRKRRTRMEESK